MADHGEVEYATATGNDYNEHEGTYEFFLHLALIGSTNVIVTLIGLTVGGVMGHWLAGGFLIFLSAVAALQGLVSGSRGFSIAVLILAFLILAVYGLG